MNEVKAGINLFEVIWTNSIEKSVAKEWFKEDQEKAFQAGRISAFEEAEKLVVRSIDKYFAGLIMIPFPELTHEELKRFVLSEFSYLQEVNAKLKGKIE